ncbi:MAG: class I SAM-dependent methyltransferase [Sedimentisphaerales bacterium]
MTADKQNIQINQYVFPYHHIPYIDGNGYGSRCRYLSWGYEYLCYQLHIRDIVLKFAPSSVLEVGCGDGAFIGNLAGKVKNLTGCDPAERAIQFARAFYPQVEFYAAQADGVPGTFDFVAAIEVLEHISPEKVCHFLQSLAVKTKPGGHIVLSVPTTVAPLNPKHHRHYDISILKTELSAANVPLKMVSFEYVYRQSFLAALYLRFTYNKLWSFEFYPLRKVFWKYVWNRLRIADEKTGRHLIAVLKREANI